MSRRANRLAQRSAAKSARQNLRSAIRSGDSRAVNKATRTVRATNTNAIRKGAALRIKKKMGYK